MSENKTGRIPPAITTHMPSELKIRAGVASVIGAAASLGMVDKIERERVRVADMEPVVAEVTNVNDSEKKPDIVITPEMLDEYQKKKAQDALSAATNYHTAQVAAGTAAGAAATYLFGLGVLTLLHGVRKALGIKYRDRNVKIEVKDSRSIESITIRTDGSLLLEPKAGAQLEENKKLLQGVLSPLIQKIGFNSLDGDEISMSCKWHGSKLEIHFSSQKLSSGEQEPDLPLLQTAIIVELRKNHIFGNQTAHAITDIIRDIAKDNQLMAAAPAR